MNEFDADKFTKWVDENETPDQIFADFEHKLYCANDPCEAEATHCIDHDDGPDITPLCATCAAAYEMGQASPDANVRPLDEEGW